MRGLLFGEQRTLICGTIGERCTLVGGNDETEERAPETAAQTRVLDAAVVPPDEAGLDAFSMRWLAQELGVVPMALYKQVANKGDLLDGIVDIVFSEIELPSGDLDWCPPCGAERSRRARP